MVAQSLTRYAWLSIAAAILTMGLKLLAWHLTGSVGLLSDALESLVNLGGAVMALMMLRIAMQPPDDDHAYGHSKAEYFSSGFEGMLILIAGGLIIWQAVPSLLDPQPLEQAWIGLAVSAAAAVVNLIVARILGKAGREHRSITLQADSHHLMTDVWTSVGILIGVALVAVTGWRLLDPIIAIAVALNILWTGVRLLRESADGLMDAAWQADELQSLEEVLNQFRDGTVEFHAIRTRRAAARRFVTFHLLVPGAWSVQQAHELAESVEARLAQLMPGVSAISHIEPIEDPASYADATHLGSGVSR
ncbi:cation diffusion facilitator family transporter [Stenotrophobium rhamnosiphilum]|uniref:Cation-efflux pump n=1 Tax=Stenotrophobium rhamnosiphilum TaxID=2029166 RepID=A0A2T5MI64_9GAMM|nr:cation diffusion facilitator family transporter [Stenotrophobium rhamnosiphilum]PTU32254.1 cation-efflux pump [Stenotrophobium rhamnosiphilum]